MPIFDFRCDACGGELMDWPAKSGEAVGCPECGAEMRRELSMPSNLRPDYGYQSAAILSNGAKVKGHWGKSAPRSRKKVSG